MVNYKEYNITDYTPRLYQMRRTCPRLGSAAHNTATLMDSMKTKQSISNLTGHWQVNWHFI